MRSRHWLAVVLGTLLAGSTVRADVTDTSPYDYDHPPKRGREAGTYAFTGTGAVGPDCIFVIIGTAKNLPNPDGTGGTSCAKANIEVRGSGPLCALGMLGESSLAVVGGTYTYNDDGTICFNDRIIGGPADGTPFTFHAYVDPKGRWLQVSGQDIAYACPGIVANGQLTFAGTDLKIGKFGDDPPGSGMLPCTNP